MSRISVRLALFISGILSDSEGISHVMMLFWQQTLWLEVVLTTVIPCLEVSLLLIFTGSSVLEAVLPELFFFFFFLFQINFITIHFNHHTVKKLNVLTYRVAYSDFLSSLSTQKLTCKNKQNWSIFYTRKNITSLDVTLLKEVVEYGSIIIGMKGKLTENTYYDGWRFSVWKILL